MSAPQQDRGPLGTGVELGHHRCGGLAGGDVEAEAGQRFEDALLGSGEFQAELGILVDGPPKLDGLGLQPLGQTAQLVARGKCCSHAG